jgi:hypothetical protein
LDAHNSTVIDEAEYNGLENEKLKSKYNKI